MQNPFIEALETIEKTSPVIGDMVRKTFYQLEIERLTDLEDIVRFTSLYIDLKGDDDIKISGRKLETLAYYLKHGYSKKTKEKILKDCKIKDSNLNNVNCELRRLGFITVDARNENKNHVDPKLSDFIKYMVDNKGEYVLIKIT